MSLFLHQVSDLEIVFQFKNIKAGQTRPGQRRRPVTEFCWQEYCNWKAIAEVTLITCFESATSFPEDSLAAWCVIQQRDRTWLENNPCTEPQLQTREACLSSLLPKKFRCFWKNNLGGEIKMTQNMYDWRAISLHFFSIFIFLLLSHVFTSIGISLLCSFCCFNTLVSLHFSSAFSNVCSSPESACPGKLNVSK